MCMVSTKIENKIFYELYNVNVHTLMNFPMLKSIRLYLFVTHSFYACVKYVQFVTYKMSAFTAIRDL